jgi:hypothetical protein
MLARPRTSTFIDTLTIEVEDLVQAPVLVELRSEDGEICCKMEKKVHPQTRSICWEGLNDLPYGVYTLACSQGEETIEVRMVKRV